MKAKDLYISTLFKKTIRFIENDNRFTNWYILSAKYGLIDKNEIIQAYDMTLLNFSNKELEIWSNSILIEIMKRKLDDLHFFCGEKYHNQYLLQLLELNGIKYTLPMKGLSLGKRLQYLSPSIKGGFGFRR